METAGDILGVWVESTGILIGRFILFFFLVFYLSFAIMLIRQVGLLNKLLGTPLSPFIKLLAWVHFLFALLIFIFSLFSLEIMG